MEDVRGCKLFLADGIRQSKRVNGLLTSYLVDKNLPYAQVLEELDNGGSVLVGYSYGTDLLSQNSVAAGQSYYHYDGLGSTRGLSNAAEALTDSYDYEAFGEVLSSSGSTPNSYLFAGEQFDNATGKYYLRARYYTPFNGRFSQADPWQGVERSPISLHKYLYANSNPLFFIDPSGFESLIQQVSTVNLASNLYTIASYSADILTGNYVGVAQDVAFELVVGKLGHLKKVGTLSQKGINLLSRALGDVKSLQKRLNLTGAADSKILRKNLEIIIGKGAKGHAAHHIVPASPISAAGKNARTILETAGININSPSNGVFLPMYRDAGFGSLHRGQHTELYEIAVWERLMNVSITGVDGKRQLADAITALRHDLLDEELILNSAK